MDTEGAEMRQQMDDTMDDLTDKLEDLGDQVSGTVKTVRKSITSVRDAFDLKGQVRRHPFTALAGATALGFFFGFHPAEKPTRERRDSVGSVNRAPSECSCAGANGNTNGADGGHAPAITVPSWLVSLEETFGPEITAVRIAAISALLEGVRGVIRNKKN